MYCVSKPQIFYKSCKRHIYNKMLTLIHTLTFTNVLLLHQSRLEVWMLGVLWLRGLCLTVGKTTLPCQCFRVNLTPTCSQQESSPGAADWLRWHVSQSLRLWRWKFAGGFSLFTLFLFFSGFCGRQWTCLLHAHNLWNNKEKKTIWCLHMPCGISIILNIETFF